MNRMCGGGSPLVDKLPSEACLKLAAALGVEEFCGLMGWEIEAQSTHIDKVVLLVPRDQHHHWGSLESFYRWVDRYLTRSIHERLEHPDTGFNERLWVDPIYRKDDYATHYPLWIKPQ